MNPPAAPEILLRRGQDILVIALSELLEYTVVEPVLMKTPIEPPEPTIFIFPGVILKTQGQAYYIPAAELTLLEKHGTAQEDAINFESGGASYAISDAELSEFIHPREVLARDQLEESSASAVFPGSLLRDRKGGLYYLPLGVFGTFASFAEASRA